MTKALFTLLAVGVITAATALPSRAEESQPSRPYVVLVGIEKYADGTILPRPKAEADVKAMYDLLVDKKYLGVPRDHIRLLLGSEDKERGSQPATRENILKSLHWLATEAKPDDLVIFAYIGEGAPLTDKGDRLCYFAADSTVKERDKNAIATADIAQELDKLKSNRFCAMIDVDFRGYKGGKEAFPELQLEESPYKEFLGSEGKDDGAPAPGRVVFLATSGRTRSIDVEKHGVFTQVILDGLKGAADKEGYEPDGVVTVDELTTYLDDTLPELARKFGETREEREQHHFVIGGRGAHFVLAQNPAVAAKVSERLDKFAQVVQSKKIPADLADEGKRLLTQMPKLEAERNLRKEYQKLVDGSLTPEGFLTARVAIIESRKLSRAVADDFADKVIRATDVILDNYVKEVSQGDMVSWAVKGMFRRIDEKLPKDLSAQLDKAKGLKSDDLRRLLADARQVLGKREDLDGQKDVDIALKMMMRNLDPYTTYIDPETLEKFRQDTRGMFTGIGIQIRKNFEKDMLEVVTPIMGSPAYKMGLQGGDILTTIIREVDSFGKSLPKPEVISTKGLALNDAVKKILGQPGTKVKIVVERPGQEKPITYEITRGRIELESVLGFHRKADDGWDFLIDPANKIGYIRLTSFASNTYRDIARVMRELTRDGDLKGLILDLRFNPGGLLTSAVQISDMYIDDGLIVSIKPRVGRDASYTGEHDGSFLNFPMVCLVNGGSASGSEIVSACLQDHGRAVIMGERSYGKGSVQNIQPFEKGEIKLTIASFWRPSGKNLNKSSTSGRDEDEWGVSPDRGFEIKLSRKEQDDLAEYQRNLEIILPPNSEKRKADPLADLKEKDRQLDKALEYLRGQIKTASRGPARKAG